MPLFPVDVADVYNFETTSLNRRLCRLKQKKHERDQTEAMGNEAEMSKYLNKVLKSKTKKT